MRPSKLTRADRIAIEDWADALARLPRVKDLAARLGCSTRTVQRWLRTAYLDARRRVLSQSDVSRGTNGGTIAPHGCTGREQERD